MNIKKRLNHKVYVQALRRISPKQRLLKAFEVSHFYMDLFLHGLRKGFPDLTDDAIKEIYLDRLNKCWFLVCFLLK